MTTEELAKLPLWFGRCVRCRGERYPGNTWCHACHEQVVRALHNPPPVGYGSGAVGRFLTTLHTGFLWIFETPEELARLRNENIAFRDSTAASKIGTTNLAEIRPIDRVAARVV